MEFTMLQSPAPTERRVQVHTLGSGARVYTLPVRVFGEMTANVYLVRRGEYLALIDTGSGSDKSNADLHAAFAQLPAHGERATLEDVQRVIITHAHIDHHGGLDMVRSHTGARVAIHALDASALSQFALRRERTRYALRQFLQQSGMDEALREEWLGMNSQSKQQFVGAPAKDIVEDGDLIDGHFRVIHTPGHCPGHICLRMGELLLSADQLLAHTTPHLGPESLMPATGLEHYLASLRRLEAEEGVQLILAGHEEPMYSVPDRARGIRESYRRKQERVLAYCAQPRTIYQIYQQLYPRAKGYDQLLALEKVGAIVEYLTMRGHLYLTPESLRAEGTLPTPHYQRSQV